MPPPGLPAGASVPRLTAIGSLLHGRFRLSMRETAEAFAERSGEVGDWGKEALRVVDKVFVARHRYRDGGDRATLQAETALLRATAGPVGARDGPPFLDGPGVLQR